MLGLNIKDPPRGGSAKTRRILREEAHFGCAICGKPYLTYHHFNPPWKEKHHDNPNGMIALCVEHDASANGGAYTPEQLRSSKKKPFLAKKNLEGYFKWCRRKFLFIVGGNFCVDCDTLISAKDEKVIWQEEDKDSGMKTLSMKILDSKGEIRLLMDKNSWIVNPNSFYDVDSSARGQKLKAISKYDGTWFQIWFRELDFKKLRVILQEGCEKVEKRTNKAFPDSFKYNYPPLPEPLLEKLRAQHREDFTSKFSQKSNFEQFMDEIEKEFGQTVPTCFLEGIFYLPQQLKLGKFDIKYPGHYLGANFMLGRSVTAFKFG